MAARRNIQESSSNGHSLSGEKTRSDTSDLDISETEALFTQIADYFDPGKPSHSSSDKKESRQTRDRKEKVTSNSAARPNTSNNVLQMLPSCSYVLPSGHHDQRIESSLSHTGEHFFPKPGRFESRGHRGFGASEDWQSGSNNPCDIESLYTHPESLRTHEPSMPAATRNISRSPRRKRNRWSSDDCEWIRVLSIFPHSTLFAFRYCSCAYLKSYHLYIYIFICNKIVNIMFT